MSEPAKESWLSQLALTTVLLAVCATLATFKGGGYSTKSVIAQAQASDQWAYYQAKSTKQNLYELQAVQLELQAQALPAGNSAQAAFQAKAADYHDKATRYEQDKKAIDAKARELEQVRDEAQRHSKPFGLAVIFLQVAILLCSIAGLMKRRLIWLGALPVGLIGILLFADGFLLFW
ncbi:protein of unknown function [Andreprevotia lacus DSM 23236]|jgi:hypothetical protein|uniref:DUF4337 domain-containing protein n=1 Tax=Andreprevotia lacus DSM 23236 TaxID=1121001 RepID=A0A1W1X8R3_9NEIS|nr:DUF4337 domain-containing protein [Andreprevotia lacus]SMC20214.1 protein of unknown function [Andreprevotia lacus DSM 23236]